MPKVKDYVSGEILTMIERGFCLMDHLGHPLLGTMCRHYGTHALKQCDTIKTSATHASDRIRAAAKVAVGQRVCNVLNGGADGGESVFLDELADGLVETGKARYVGKEEAIRVLTRDRKGPVMLTRVSGKYMEICRAIAKNCIYWNAEMHGMKCIQRQYGSEIGGRTEKPEDVA